LIDPLTDIVSLLRPSARLSKHVVGAGPWRISRTEADQPFYCAVLEGACRVAMDGHDAITLEAGDFLLLPAARNMIASSLQPAAEGREHTPVALGDGVFRIGDGDGPVDLRLQIGHCSFDSPDADLLVSLLPQQVHIRGEPRLATLVKLVGEESRAERPARDEVLSRLLEVLLIEALRSTADTSNAPGLVRGLADTRLVLAIRAMHEQPARAWSVTDLAKQAALSRSAFFERFNRIVGIAPMAYLLAWRMALAKHLLRKQETSVTAIAERVGYRSASTFSVAFARHVGMPPTRYARIHAGASA